MGGIGHLTGELFGAIAPQRQGPRALRQAAIAGAIGARLGETLAAHGIDRPLRAAHFLAQLAHESDGFTTTEEYASGAAYEGRLDIGNDRPGDGVRFKGRGLIQLTGRANYRRFGRLVGLDLEAEPERAAEPLLSLRLACLYWRAHRLNGPADRDDLEAVTRAVNGGLRGLEDRARYLARAKAALGAGLPAASHPTIGPGARGGVVRELQAALAMRGAAIAVDGIYGPRTALAVRAWQAQNGLDADGVAGPRTWASLAAGEGDDPGCKPVGSGIDAAAAN